MLRQNFLSKESFVDASEKQTRDTILSVPSFAPNIKMIAENKMVESIRFSYDQPERKLQYYVDVSILPLNEQYTRISLHAAHTNGQILQNHSDVSIALHDFESAIQAALKGDVTSYKPIQPKIKSTEKFNQVLNVLTTSIVVFFLRRKLS